MPWPVEGMVVLQVGFVCRMWRGRKKFFLLLLLPLDQVLNKEGDVDTSLFLARVRIVLKTIGIGKMETLAPGSVRWWGHERRSCCGLE